MDGRPRLMAGRANFTDGNSGNDSCRIYVVAKLLEDRNDSRGSCSLSCCVAMAAAILYVGASRGSEWNGDKLENLLAPGRDALHHNRRCCQFICL